MRNDINSIVFYPEKYDTNEDMWNDISKFMRMLIKNEYIFVTHEEDFHMVVIEYNYADRGMGHPYPVFLSPDEEDSVSWDSEKVAMIDLFENNKE